MNGTRSVGILATGSYLPEKVLTNSELEKMVDTTDEWITKRTGIRSRHVAAPEQASSDLAYEAALRAMAKANITAEQLGMIVVATATPDHAFPSTACILQDRLGATKAAALDISAACTGFLYGISMASQYIAMGVYRYVLVVGVETISRILNYEDRNTCILFGDGAGAAVLGSVREGYGFRSFDLGSDGSGGKHLLQPAGGSRMPATRETLDQKLHTIAMTGQEVFKFAVRVMNDSTTKVIQKAGITAEEIDLLVPHQANIRIIESATKSIGLPAEKVVINLDHTGNMSAASIPVALDEAIQAGRVQEGNHIVLVGFGAGLTWGGAVLKWTTQEEV